MFDYINRKFKGLFWGPRIRFKEISQGVLEQVENPPEVHLTRNPFKCFSDNAMNVEYNPFSHKVRVCKNLVKSEEDFSGSLLREVVWMEDYRNHLHTNNFQELKSLVKACKAELNQVQGLDPISVEEGSRICTKLYAKQKLSNSDQRQLDAWHFYTRNLIDKNWAKLY
mmetsp:Transcript_6983/g.10287  ORF Transcript_6983/g.10287 Transcript_6983/m.10287 type:complete len:168 (-) Transcript_6983:1026-1529(-)